MLKLFKYLFFISIGVSIILGFVVSPHHPHFFWENIPVFDVVYGFIGCILIIVGSKALGHAWLQKDEDYYG